MMANHRLIRDREMLMPETVKASAIAASTIVVPIIHCGHHLQDLWAKPTHPTLGAFRLSLAIMVFSSHVTYKAAHLFYYFSGIHAVVTFFITSGFLIGLAIERNYVGRTGEFVLNRFLRIYPTFWVVLGLTALTIVLHGGPTVRGADIAAVSLLAWGPIEVLRALPIVTGYPASIWGPMNVAWSLQVELSFYIAVATLYWALNACYGRDATAKRGRGVLLACCAALGIYIISSSIIELRFENPIAYIPDFVLGLAISRSVLNRDSASIIWPLIGTALFLSLLGFSHIIVTGGPHLRLFAPFSSFASRLSLNDGFNVQTLATLIGVFMVCLLIKPGLLARRIDSFLGDLTYPLYLCHFAVLATMNQDFPGMPDEHRIWLSFAAALLCAVLLYLFVDRPLTRLRAYIRKGALPPPSSIADLGLAGSTGARMSTES
jgi:peptidoglycan/LPS O-acetylase OafA/YrhL